jgi:predicted RNase H-like nuclease
VVAVVGVDACKSGWIAVVLRPGRTAEAHHLTVIDRLAEAVPDAELVGIDIPIGFPERDPRQADVAARRVLGPRRSSVFLTPVREALAAPSHAEATAIALRRSGSGMSRQAYGLATKVFEVERYLPAAPWPIFEVHPEVSFAVLLGAPAHASKRSWAGMAERRQALAGAGIELDGVRGDAGTLAAVDDMLDAGAVAWSAARLRAGSARSFPDPPEVGPDGRLQAIWA